MSMVHVHLNNVASIEELRRIINEQGSALLRAINDTGRWAHRETEKRVTKDVNWPAGYINQKTLSFKPARSLASGGAAISARTRPSTMTRFALSGQKMRDKNGLRFEVNKGSQKTLKNAFFFGGKTVNMLVAMREDKYFELPNTSANKYVWNGLVFLYGPSVDQVFKTHRDGNGGIADQALDKLEAAFARLTGT